VLRSVHHFKLCIGGCFTFAAETMDSLHSLLGAGQRLQSLCWSEK
jgi:hypothetical protein